jgi:hypothetical protein
VRHDSSTVKLAYKRPETDVEFRERVWKHPAMSYAGRYLKDYHGELLDDFVWDVTRLQRRIVEVFP